VRAFDQEQDAVNEQALIVCDIEIGRRDRGVVEASVYSAPCRKGDEQTKQKTRTTGERKPRKNLHMMQLQTAQTLTISFQCYLLLACEGDGGGKGVGLSNQLEL
jgi:hypothetical protein